MSSDSLRELLARVHERLGQAGSVDPEARRLLVTVMEDIQRTLGAPPGAVSHGERAVAPAGRAAGSGDATHAHRLEALAVQFEAEHPALAQGLRQLMDALGKAGI